jgi:hypothetical protein
MYKVVVKSTWAIEEGEDERILATLETHEHEIAQHFASLLRDYHSSRGCDWSEVLEDGELIAVLSGSFPDTGRVVVDSGPARAIVWSYDHREAWCAHSQEGPVLKFPSLE